MLAVEQQSVKTDARNFKNTYLLPLNLIKTYLASSNA